MLDAALYRLSIPFAIVTGCGAGVLAVLAWEMHRDSPFGSALKLLAVVMSIATVYHGGLLVFESETVVLEALLILGYILILLTLLTAIWELNHEIWVLGTFRHQKVLAASVLGSLFYAVGGPISEVFLPELLHWMHGFGALFTTVGLYGPVHDDLQNKPRIRPNLDDDGRDGYQPPEWMLPIDVAILELLYTSGLILTPAVIALNIDYSRDEVNRRLSKLEAEELVHRVERGKYGLTDKGERQIEG